MAGLPAWRERVEEGERIIQEAGGRPDRRLRDARALRRRRDLRGARRRDGGRDPDAAPAPRRRAHRDASRLHARGGRGDHPPAALTGRVPAAAGPTIPCPRGAFAPCPPLKSVGRTSRVCTFVPIRDVKSTDGLSTGGALSGLLWSAIAAVSAVLLAGAYFGTKLEPRGQPAAASPHRLQSSGKWDGVRRARLLLPGRGRPRRADRGAGARTLPPQLRARRQGPAASLNVAPRSCARRR